MNNKEKQALYGVLDAARVFLMDNREPRHVRDAEAVHAIHLAVLCAETHLPARHRAYSQWVDTNMRTKQEV